MNNPIREIIKSNLQKLSKDELVDALADVYMACPPFSIANMLSNVQEIKSPIKEAINQQANMQRIILAAAERNGLGATPTAALSLILAFAILLRSN